ncbi:MAG: peptidyl-prolyl cis-trans isomerase B (cyclophilin B) [Planctomycetota bacterium]
MNHLSALLLPTILFSFTPFLVGCGGSEPTEEEPESEVSDDSDQQAGPSEAVSAELSRFAPGGDITDAELANYHIEMTCEVDGKDIGTMAFELWTEEAPISTRNFLRLVDEGFYDGLSFHRILRTFMIQGGDPTGTGTGNSPHGTIRAEFSDAPERRHGYGVLSMARSGGNPDSASSQFFLCCDESGSVWSLDNNYSSFGKLAAGVTTLEALANVPTTASPNGEPSKPTQLAKITKATVKDGAPAKDETIERPMPTLDLGGEPERVLVQHVLISFDGCGIPGVTRTKEEAEALANTVLERAQKGDSMDELAREFSDDRIAEGDTTPGHYGVLNTGVRDMVDERRVFTIQNDFRAAVEELQAKVRAGSLSQADFQTQGQALQTEAQEKAGEGGFMPRAGLVPSFGETAFGLDVEEIGMASFDEAKSPFGFHIIKRLE